MSSASKKVLLIEDNADNRLLARMLLEHEGYEVIAVANGEDGVAAVPQHDFAFVLLDLQLPDLDGFDVARRIRERHPASELPLIAVSAFVTGTERKKAFAAGCTGYLEKPIEPEAFVAQVRCMAGLELAQ